MEEKKKARVTSAARSRARAELMLVLQTMVIMDFFMSDVEKKLKVPLVIRLRNKQILLKLE